MGLHISHQHKTLVFPYRGDVEQLIPHARRLVFDNQNMLVVPHKDDESRLLRNLGLDVPAPIMEHYDWPGDRKPFIQQMKTAAMMTMHPRCFVLNQMGTGKTKSALWSFGWLRAQGKAKKMLVVAPLSTLRFVWNREALLTLSNIKVSVIDGERARKEKRLAEDADIYIINHDGVKSMFRQLLAKHFDVIVVDEASAFRNARADRSKAMQKIAAGKSYVWLMTGSPTPTAPTDAFGLAQLGTPQTAPKSFTHYRALTMEQVSNFKWVPRREAADIVASTLQPSCCYTLEDTIELPPLIERPFDVDQGPRQKAIYRELKNKAAALLKEGALTAVNGGVVLSKLLQVSSGYVYLDNGGYAVLDNHDRLQNVTELIDGAREKVIIFCPFIHTVKGVSAHLEHERFDYAVVTGDTSSGERDRIFRSFQGTSQYDILLAHPQCMAHGLTLTAADTIIWFSPVTSLEIFDQANARITRVGQTKKQQVFMLQGTEAEKRMYSRLMQKRDNQDNALDLIIDITR